MLKRVKGLDLLLGCLFLVGLASLTPKPINDKLPTWLRGTVHDVAVGIVVSLFVWLLVVRLPELDKRRRVRRSLRLQYDAFKESCVRVFLGALGGAYDLTLTDLLKDRDQFREFFNEPLSSSQSRWDGVANGLDAEGIRNLTVEFEIFRAEVRFTLLAVDVENQEALAFLKNLANTLYRARDSSPHYDSVSSLLGLMWSVHTGWSFVGGDPGKDVIAEMIEAI